jgi:hypothetical protein
MSCGAGVASQCRYFECCIIWIIQGDRNRSRSRITMMRLRISDIYAGRGQASVKLQVIYFVPPKTVTLLPCTGIC